MSLNWGEASGGGMEKAEKGNDGNGVSAGRRQKGRGDEDLKLFQPLAPSPMRVVLLQ